MVGSICTLKKWSNKKDLEEANMAAVRRSGGAGRRPEPAGGGGFSASGCWGSGWGEYQLFAFVSVGEGRAEFERAREGYDSTA